MAFVDNQNKEIEKKFAGMKSSLGARQVEAQRQNEMALARAANASGGFGGAEMKLKDESNRKLQEGFGAMDAELGAAEAEMKLGVGEAERGREFAREERLGSEAFARSQMAMQDKQFQQSLDQAKYFFQTEFDENSRTNMTNTMLGLKASGFLDKNTDDWSRFFDSSFGSRFGDVFGSTKAPFTGVKRG